jgi:hypothetical protein
MIKKVLQREFQHGILLFVAAKNAKKQHSLKKRKVKLTLDFKTAKCYINKASLEANDL